MKMTKIESARIIAKQKGYCGGVHCKDCFITENCYKVDEKTSDVMQRFISAESYIKRHEQKSKKKEHIRDATKKVEEPKPVKTVGIDNSDITLAKPTVKENLSVPCEEECPANSEYPDPIRVDIPDIFYCPTPQGILRFKRSQIILKDTNSDDCLLKYHEEYPCYRTIEEAVIVAKKLWGGEKK